MVDFCCCALKPHSYFLLINYFSSTIFAMLLETFAYQGILHSPTYGLKAFIWILIFLTLIFLIVNLTAFLHYIFEDNINSTFHKFYVNYQIFYTITGLAFSVGFLVFNIATAKHLDVAFVMVTYLSLGIVFLSLLLVWSFRLKAVIYEEEPNAAVDNVNENNSKPFVGDGVKVDEEGNAVQES